MPTRRLRTSLISAVCAVLLGGGLSTAPYAASATPSQEDLPVFEYRGVITDKDEMSYNPTGEYIFPGVFHAGAHLTAPLGEWYLYLAPHDAPGGIVVMYADALTGPWTEHPASPVIGRHWAEHYSASHVSTPEPFWHPTEEQLFLYFHGENTTTRYATSSDGVTFEYGGVAVTAVDGGPGVTETSYARVFEHPDPASEYAYAMFYMDNTPQDIRRIRVAESHDARDWDVRTQPLVVPGPAEGQNVSSANLWEWEGQQYVIYHASSGKIHARTVDDALTETGPTWTLHEASGVGEDSGRVAAPEIVSDDTGTYLFYEGGHRLGATIAYAELNPDAVREPGPVPDPDPFREKCSGAASDEFEAKNLDAERWSFHVRDDSSRHELKDGTLVLPTYPAGVNGTPLLLQELPDGAWEVTTEVSVLPMEPFQQAGLLLYADDANYAKLDLVHGSNGPRLEYIWRQHGTDRNTGADSIHPGTDLGETFWLRLTSDGTAAVASVSFDGQTFQQWGRSVDLAALDAQAVGPFAMRGATGAPEIEAAFSWLRWTPTPAEREVCDAELTVPEPPADTETAPPGQAALRSTSGWSTGLHDGVFDVLIDLWWGTNASVVALYENDILVAVEQLELDSPSAQSVRIPLAGQPNGTYVYTAVLSNSQGSTRSQPAIVTVTDAAPARPVLSHDNTHGVGSFVITADLWWGTNASAYRLLEDGEPVAEGSLDPATPGAQRTSVALTDREPGSYRYVAEFSNHAGTTLSRPLTVAVRE